MAEQIAAAFAFCAFAVSIAGGLAVGAPATTILLRSLVVLVAAGTMGRVLGHMVRVAMNEHLTATLAGNPIPEPIRLPRGRLESDDVEVVEDVESP